MAAVGTVAVNLEARTAALSNGLAKGRADVERFAKGTESRIKAMKSAMGEDSQLGQTLKMLQGAGAVAGVAMIGNALESVTAKAAELANQFRAGSIAAGEMAEGLIRSIPIIGKFFTAGQNIREAITGEREAQKEAEEKANNRQKNADKRATDVSAAFEGMRQFEADQKRARDEAAFTGGWDIRMAGGDDPQAALQREHEQRLRAMREQNNKALEYIAEQDAASRRRQSMAEDFGGDPDQIPAEQRLQERLKEEAGRISDAAREQKGMIEAWYAKSEEGLDSKTSAASWKEAAFVWQQAADDEAKAGEELAKRRQELLDSIATPEEKYAASLGKLEQLQADLGGDGLSADQLQAARDKLSRDIFGEPKTASASDTVVRRASYAVLRNGGDDLQKRIVTSSEKTAQAVTAIERAVASGGLTVYENAN